MKTGMTELERLVAARLRDGVPPWGGGHGAGSRTISQALGRMNRKGFVAHKHARWTLTAAGRAALEGGA